MSWSRPLLVPHSRTTENSRVTRAGASEDTKRREVWQSQRKQAFPGDGNSHLVGDFGVFLGAFR